MLTVLLGAPLAVAVLVGVLLLSLLSKLRKKKAELSAIPTFPEEHWLWGHWAWFSSPRVWKGLHEKAKELGPIYRIRIATLFSCVVTDQVRSTTGSRPWHSFAMVPIAACATKRLTQPVAYVSGKCTQVTLKAPSL